MSASDIATPSHISYFDISPSVEQARQQVPQAKERLTRAEQRVFKPFMLVQNLVCGLLLIKWVLDGHYIAGPIFAILLWCVSWLLFIPLGWFARHERRALKQAEENVGVVLHKARTDFLAEQALGPYRWIYRGDDMLGLFLETAVLYLYSAQTHFHHALIDVPNVVRQVRVDQATHTFATSNTHTTHGKRDVRATGTHSSVIQAGHSNSTTYTSTSNTHTYTLQIQLQVEAQTPFWTTWSFGSDWQEAENWRLQIAQAAGLEGR